MLGVKNLFSDQKSPCLSQMGEVACYTPLCPECQKPPPGGGSSKEVKPKPQKDGSRGQGASK